MCLFIRQGASIKTKMENVELRAYATKSPDIFDIFYYFYSSYLLRLMTCGLATVFWNVLHTVSASSSAVYLTAKMLSHRYA